MKTINLLITGLALALFFSACKKDEPTLATLTTIAVTNITVNSAESGGIITDDGNSPVLSRGVVWSKSQSPTVEANNGITSSGQGIRDFRGSFYPFRIICLV